MSCKLKRDEFGAGLTNEVDQGIGFTLEEVNSLAVGESGVPIGRGLYGGMGHSPTCW